MLILCLLVAMSVADGIPYNFTSGSVVHLPVMVQYTQAGNATFGLKADTLIGSGTITVCISVGYPANDLVSTWPDEGRYLFRIIVVFLCFWLTFLNAGCVGQSTLNKIFK